MRLAIIPARGGSKRLPRKNIKDFMGKPIIAYTVELARKSGLFDSVIVSTDDREIMTIAKQYGAEVPFIRSAALAGDDVRANDVVIDVIQWVKKNHCKEVDLVCCIYPTAVLLQEKYLIDGLNALLAHPDKQFAFSVVESQSAVQRSFLIDKNQDIKMFFPESYGLQSQDLPKTYHGAGQFYWGRSDAFLKHSTIFGKNAIPIIVPQMLMQDINTIDDWELAKLKYQWVRRKTDIMFSLDKLVLGTVQFGLPYGVTNFKGVQVLNEDISNMLHYAELNGIHRLDTASVYGESEQVLGELLGGSAPFKIITKLYPITQNSAAEFQEKIIQDRDVELMYERFEESCLKLKSLRLYGVMVHSALDLLSPGGEKTYALLTKLKQEGRVEKIGCSFYYPNQLFEVLDRFELDIVQIPLNLFDQSFIISGAIDELKKRKIEVYARSVFLQGLLLATKTSLPEGMGHVYPYIQKLDEFCKTKRVTRLELILTFLKQQQNLHYVIGFNSFKEMLDVVEAAKKIEDYKLEGVDFANFAIEDRNIIDPTLWPTKKERM